MIEEPYKRGRQPCDAFKAMDSNWWGGNVHQCYRCDGEVSFCENCHTDHHKNGYETCKPEGGGT